MVNLLETLYLVTGVCALAAVGYGTARYRSPDRSMYRRKARLFGLLAATSGGAALILYVALRP